MHRGQIDLILPCIVNLLDLLCIWSTLHQRIVVNSLSQYMVETQIVHWMAAKHILRYIIGTVVYGLVYERTGSVQLTISTDIDWEGCVEGNGSTSGCCFSIGSRVVSWLSKKQKSAALSSAGPSTWLLVRVCGRGSYFHDFSSVT